MYSIVIFPNDVRSCLKLILAGQERIAEHSYHEEEMSRFDIHFENDTINGQWQLGHVLGSGAKGVVYSATDRMDRQNSVVIKFACALDDDPRLVRAATNTLAHEEDMLRYLNEKASYLNVPKLLDSGCHKGYPYLVMTRFGTDVATLWDNSGHFSTSTVLKITYEVFNTVKALHEHGISHGDIKGANIVCAAPGQDQSTVYVIDFGESDPLTAEMRMRDIANILNLMIKMLSNNSRGLLAEMEFLPAEWTEATAAMQEEVYINVEKTYDIRRGEKSPLPEEIRAVVDEFLACSSPNYSRLQHLLLGALTRVQDSSRPEFDWQ